MEYIKNEDLKLIISCAGEEVNNTDFDKLKNVYGKLKHICDLLVKKGFKYEIRQDPRKQAGLGRFVFQDYQWAKVYPSEFYDIASDKFAYIIGFSDTVHFHLMGIKDFQYQKASTEASQKCWTVLDFENKNYEFVVDEFLKFDKSYRNLFIETGFKLGITDFKKYLKKINIDKKINLLEYKKQIILQGPPGTGKTREAKLIAKEILELDSTDKLKDNEQFKLIQFHPSYTYEDFVRGIVAESKGNKIEYKNVNKTLGEFAELALKNYKDSQKIPEQVSIEKWLKNQYVKFKEDLQKEIEIDNEVLIKEGTKPKITFVEDDSLRVNRYSNENDSVLVKDLDIIYGYIGLYLSETIINIRKNELLSKSARSGMYYLYQNLIEKFKKYLEDNNLVFDRNSQIEKVEIKPYILVIDEINRANLSSVLGELIYALEYRGEEVESMYEVDGSRKLILPPNLYIIGTMNTADRSVGHIDYAIRRRFAFVDVLPEKLEDNSEIYFNTTDFMDVAKLFIKIEDNVVDFEKAENSDFLSDDFSAKDVALGHSYFIADKNKVKETEKQDYFKMKMKYEVVPILNEYLKDGVFNEKATVKIKEIEQRFA